MPGMMRGAVVGILTALSLAACEGDADNVHSVDFQTIDRGYSSDIVLVAPEAFKIDNQAEWSDWWARHTSGGSPIPLPAVDFSRDSVVAVVDKQESSGGFEMDINSVTDEGTALRVKAARTEPGANCEVTTAFTRPYHIVRMDRNALPVVLELSVKIRECPPLP